MSGDLVVLVTAIGVLIVALIGAVLVAWCLLRDGDDHATGA